MSYNHKEAVKKLTPEQYQKNLNWAYKSYRQALKETLVTYRGCEKNFRLFHLYRC